MTDPSLFPAVDLIIPEVHHNTDKPYRRIRITTYPVPVTGRILLGKALALSVETYCNVQGLSLVRGGFELLRGAMREMCVGGQPSTPR